jgi:hypothetical protein
MSRGAVSVDPNGLATGTDIGLIVYNANGAADTPRTLTVEMHIWCVDGIWGVFFPFIHGAAGP